MGKLIPKMSSVVIGLLSGLSLKDPQLYRKPSNVSFRQDRHVDKLGALRIKKNIPATIG